MFLCYEDQLEPADHHIHSVSDINDVTSSRPPRAERSRRARAARSLSFCEDEALKTLVGFLAGGAYGLTSVAVGQPLDTVKTRMHRSQNWAREGCGSRCGMM